MSDPHAQRRVSATIKFPESARYKNDNPWLVFEGSVETVREQLIEAFNMEETEGLSLASLVANAQQQVNAIANVAAGLGGKVISEGSSTGSAWGKPKGEAAPAAPEKTPEELEIERLLPEVEAVTTVQELQELWARNQKAFESDQLMAAYRAKGTALTAA